MTAKSIKHKFVNAIADGGDATIVRPSNWNDDHDLWLGYRTVSGTTDTISNADHLTLITYSNGGAVTATLPAPTGGNMPSGWMTKLRNIGPGTVTVTGSGGATINIAGVANPSYVLNQGDTLDIYSQGTTAYFGVLTKSPSASAGKTLSINIQTFAASGTYTPSANMVSCQIECIGGGGGGGGCTAGPTDQAFGAGGGSGSYSKSAISAATIGASQAVTIGAGGTAGTGAGGTGGVTSLGALVTANGGVGGLNANSTNLFRPGGAGGAPGTGQVAAAGAPGGTGVFAAGAGQNIATASFGGSSAYGGGGNSPQANAAGGNVAGVAGRAYGSGGSGGAATAPTSGSASGGVGSAGVVIITEFIMS